MYLFLYYPNSKIRYNFILLNLTMQNMQPFKQPSAYHPLLIISKSSVTEIYPTDFNLGQLSEPLKKIILNFFFGEIIPEDEAIQAEFVCWLLNAEHGKDIPEKLNIERALKKFLHGVTVLDLKNKDLNTNCLRKLVPALKDNTSVNLLNLSSNYFSNWEDIECILKKNPDLILVPSLDKLIIYCQAQLQIELLIATHENNQNNEVAISQLIQTRPFQIAESEAVCQPQTKLNSLDFFPNCSDSVAVEEVGTLEIGVDREAHENFKEQASLTDSRSVDLERSLGNREQHNLFQDQEPSCNKAWHHTFLNNSASELSVKNNSPVKDNASASDSRHQKFKRKMPRDFGMPKNKEARRVIQEHQKLKFSFEKGGELFF